MKATTGWWLSTIWFADTSVWRIRLYRMRGDWKRWEKNNALSKGLSKCLSSNLHSKKITQSAERLWWQVVPEFTHIRLMVGAATYQPVRCGKCYTCAARTVPRFAQRGLSLSNFPKTNTLNKLVRHTRRSKFHRI